MGKQQKQADIVGQQKQKNKTHKTLRQKLRKKRLQQKQHMKQKKQKKKQFDPENQKRQFFDKHFNSLQEDKYKQAKKQFKYKKIKKYIEKFINIYQDDLEDFFGLFKEFDEGGFIDIGGLENKKLHKVLTKLFKYLPLNVSVNQDTNATEYRKKQESKLNLQAIIKNLVTEAIENYMENGTQDEKDKSSQSQASDNQGKNINELKSSKKSKNVTVNVRNQDDEAVFTLPLPKIQPQSNAGFGPCISAQQRQKIAQLFQKQLKQMQQQQQQLKKQQQDQFDKIFSSGQTASKLKDPKRQPKKSALEDIPQHLLAQGSARIGQKMTINEDQQDNYDALHRPKKLIEEHREIMQINQGGSQTNSRRKPFDRERDVVNSRSRVNASNLGSGVFFDFKDKMTAPKKTNNFL